MPSEAVGFNATAVSRDSIGADGANISGEMSAIVVSIREVTGSPHRAAYPSRVAPRELWHAAGAVPEGSNG
ncbi:hypothetical protein Raf01_42990 [Rugosimonospora africana]|uniref:Uncharacterized protein n=1 Tax=Rugosimonospora africana TaxID=556532 RepID=A0A8J3QU60_9ACTN|nr:hypothetical protein Raf01_42990 [Rugosimonospora africana]